MLDEPDDDEVVVPQDLAVYSDRSPSEVEREVCSVSARSTLDNLCAMIDAAEWLMARARSIHHLSRQIAIGWIEKNGEFDIGTNHYSVGYTTTIRCLDRKKGGLHLLDAVQGDFEGFLETLVSQPYKSGSAKKLLNPAHFNRLFASRRTGRLIAGAPERVLKRIDQRFIR